MQYPLFNNNSIRNLKLLLSSSKASNLNKAMKKSAGSNISKAVIKNAASNEAIINHTVDQNIMGIQI